MALGAVPCLNKWKRVSLAVLAANGNGRMFLRDFARRAVVHEPGNTSGNWRCR